MPAGGRESPALPSALGTLSVSSHAGQVAGGTRVGRAAPELSPARAGPRSPLAGPSGAGGDLILVWGVRPCSSPFGAKYCSLQSPAAPLFPGLALWRGHWGG